MSTYFILHKGHSYSGYGAARNYYVFKAGEPTKIDDPRDAQKFRYQRDRLYECNKDGKPLNPALMVEKAVKPLTKVTLDPQGNVVSREDNREAKKDEKIKKGSKRKLFSSKKKT